MFIDRVKTLPDMVNLRPDIEDFLSLFKKTSEGWNIKISLTYKSRKEAQQDLQRVQKLAQKLSRELNH